MPTARVLKDGDLAFTASTFGPNYRYSATFQVLPRLYGTFRYSQIPVFAD
ncbi:YjbH domain-containing protein [Sulfitobacter pontiacus]